MRIRTLIFLLAALLLLGASPALAAEGEEESGVEDETTVEEAAEDESTTDESAEESTVLLTDVSGTWYEAAAELACAEGWMDSGDGGLFDGERIVTRAMTVDAIWRMAGSPKASVSIGYADVEAQNPCHDAIDWANEAGVANGVGHGYFDPDGNVTREQLATMLYRYARTQGMGFSGTWMLELDTKDGDRVSDWAKEGVCWFYRNGVMTGRGENYEPQGSTKRAELATVLCRYDFLVHSEDSTSK